MTRIRIEGLLAAFPKLLGSDTKQHTYVETESVRYVYQPMDTMFLLLITTRSSNIIEDLETLRLLSKVVPDIAGATSHLNEEKISEKCFELIFAFDEVLNFGGYKESITLQQIRSNLEMESHEEKLHNMIKLSKMESARDQANNAAKIIRERKREQQRLGVSTGMQGIGGGEDSEGLSSLSSYTPSALTPEPIVPLPSPSIPSSSGKSLRGANVKGMSLSAGPKNRSLEEALVKEDKLSTLISKPSPIPSSSSSSSTPAPLPQVQHPVMLAVVEKVNARVSRDGVVESLEIKGSLVLNTSNDDVSLCSVQLAVRGGESFAFSTHPKVNKSLYDKNQLLQLKDTSKGFPSARPVGILKWSLSGPHEELLPIQINCWPEEEGGGQMNVSIEYNLSGPVELHDVVIRIPLGTSDPPHILSADGSHRHNPSTAELLWELPMIDQSCSTGSLEFNIAQRDLDAFFPISVGFSSHQLFCGVEVVGVTHSQDGRPLQFGFSKSMSSEEFLIG